MGKVRNILFVMCDQLRADYLGCTGHPIIRTPNIDALARRGVRFTRAYCQAPVCGPSRMSFYTGRYMTSHGAHYNDVPLRADEWTIGDYLRPLGLRVGLVGKTHFAVDRQGFARLGVDLAAPAGRLAAECGFEAWERDDGLHPDQAARRDLPYNRYLRAQGYEGENPWHSIANSAAGPQGELLSGWEMRHAHLPARVDRAHSETAYMTDRAMATIAELGEAPWLLHLSYIKPHWPYMAPAPYHALYAGGELPPANRTAGERAAPHPVIGAFMQHDESQAFARDEVRARIVPTYMGLVTEIDDHIGRLMAFLDRQGRLADTLIIFTSDHGDYLGDHWLGEKELFHEESVRIPLIIVDPDGAADAGRGSEIAALVESIDLLPSFVEIMGGVPAAHRLEGRSLLPLLRGAWPGEWRDAVFSETDYAWRRARLLLRRAPHEARAVMIRTVRWKYVSYDGFRPQLFDLEADPLEQADLGESAAHATVRNELEQRIGDWARHRRLRTTVSDEAVAQRTDTAKQRGILFGQW
jgi:arylsulfatase A-like enzyme